MLRHATKAEAIKKEAKRNVSTENGKDEGNGKSQEKSNCDGSSLRLSSPLNRLVHKPQDSLFSATSGWTNYRGFFNLAMLLLIVSNGRVALENLIKYGVLISPVAWFQFFVADVSFFNWPNLFLVAASNVLILVVFATEKLLARSFVKETFAVPFYCALLAVQLVAPVVITLTLRSNPIYSCGALSIIVIETLKMSSYVHVNYWCRFLRSGVKRKAEEETTAEVNGLIAEGEKMTTSEALALYPANLTLSNLYYFLVAPTLCYELKFPLSPRRRKLFLLKRAAELIFLSFLIMALVQQWVVPLLKNSLAPFSQMKFSRCLERLLKLAIPNIFIWLIFFYTVFHSALNLNAEVLRFADREFYRDFWNAESISYFWKTWNIPVHRWALRHIYLPMKRHGYSSKAGMICVFVVSAAFHEYLVSVPLHMFRLWAYYGMIAQIPLSYMTDKIIRGGRPGNIVVWLSLILGQPLAILMYVHDWYIINYPPTFEIP